MFNIHLFRCRDSTKRYGIVRYTYCVANREVVFCFRRPGQAFLFFTYIRSVPPHSAYEPLTPNRNCRVINRLNKEKSETMVSLLSCCGHSVLGSIFPFPFHFNQHNPLLTPPPQRSTAGKTMQRSSPLPPRLHGKN